jgi:VacB/RNase II family 3'-5' exoribonuclease
MKKTANQNHRSLLQRIARRAMTERGLLTELPDDASAELQRIHPTVTANDGSVRDLRSLLWCSIDNDDSRDLDQLTVAESLPDGDAKLMVAIADVDVLVMKLSALDNHAKHNTTSVYTAARIFPMLPEKLSTDLTSLNPGSERLAVVVEMIISPEGILRGSDIFRAMVRNQAKLAYNSVGAWLDGKGPIPETVNEVRGLEENLRLQNRIARILRSLRQKHGALDLETIETRPVFEGDEIKDLKVEERNAAKDIIEDFMITANGVTARYLSEKQVPSLRRIVRTPQRWGRIVELALDKGFTLSGKPDSKSLDKFLLHAKNADPIGFPDLSLSIIKLLGSGEYVLELPGETSPGHFGLAVKDYTHSTAPNRRYPDLITQRLLKAAIKNGTVPYTSVELGMLADHCTLQEDVAKKVERQVGKSAAALLLESRINQRFDAIVTGASAKGTWVRIFHPPIEGKLVRNFEGLDVGQRLQVQLLQTDVERGFIDFKRISS